MLNIPGIKKSRRAGDGRAKEKKDGSPDIHIPFRQFDPYLPHWAGDNDDNSDRPNLPPPPPQ